MRVLLSSLGSHGDIHPFVAVARALGEKGHDAAVAANPYFRSVIEGAGVAFLPLGEHIDLAESIQQTPGAMAQHGGSLRLVKNWVVPLTGEHVESLASHARAFRADVIVGHSITFYVPIVCELLGLPFVACNLAPVAWMNPADYPVYSAMDRTWPPWLLCRINLKIGRLLMRWTVDGEINRVRRAAGVSTVREAWYSMDRGGVLNLGLWSPVFRGPHEGDPPTGVICGFPWLDRASGHEDDMGEIGKFLDDGDAPLVFTLGTASVHNAGRFFHAAVEAAATLRKRALLVAGRTEYFPEGLPKGVRAFTYAPFSRVFPRGLVNVHHGGIGTTAQALRAGRPQLVTPMAHDQFDNSARVKRLGAGDRLNHNVATGSRMSRALQHLIDDPAIATAAADVARKIEVENGAMVAAETIVHLGAKPTGRSSQGMAAHPSNDR